MNQTIELTLPAWIDAEVARLPATLPDVDQRMQAVIRFSQLNIEQQTGGPFAAGVFETVTGRLVAMGVNRVMASGCSSAHAEVMALSLAQLRTGSYDLGAVGQPAHQLVVNWRPCAMCYGALVWSGVTSLVVAGDGPELESMTGFDEGPIHPDWEAQLLSRGITVTKGVLKAGAISVFRQFAESGATVYNGRGGLS